MWSWESPREAELRPGRRPGRSRLTSAIIAALALPLAIAGGGGVSGCSAARSGPAGGETPTTVVVLAASSLTEPMTAIARDFESSHPGTDIQVSFAASSTLVTQVNQGAPADLLALAGATAAEPLAKACIVGDAP